MKKGNLPEDGEKREAGLTEDLEEKTRIEVSEADTQEGQEAETVVSKENADALAEARLEANAHKDRWLRLAAEFDNYKKRTAREFEALVQSASEDIIRDILPTLDAVDRALAHVGDGDVDSEEFRQGIKMIMEQLPKVLHNRGLVEIEAAGEPFDPHYHEALMQVASETHDAGIVADVVERGYLLGNKVLRHAKVVVSSGPAQETKPDKD